jgi:hypothetical protein
MIFSGVMISVFGVKERGCLFLTQLGTDGWEMTGTISVTGTYGQHLFFKRPQPWKKSTIENTTNTLVMNVNQGIFLLSLTPGERRLAQASFPLELLETSHHTRA